MKRGVLRVLNARVGHSLWKASEVDSDQTLRVYIVKHAPFDTVTVMVGVSIALHALLLALSRDIPSFLMISHPHFFRPIDPSTSTPANDFSRRVTKIDMRHDIPC